VHAEKGQRELGENATALIRSEKEREKVSASVRKRVARDADGKGLKKKRGSL